MADPAPGEKYALFTDRNAGLGCNIFMAAKAVRFEKLSGRKLVTLWPKCCFYSDGVVDDAFTMYFEPIGNIEASELAGKAQLTVHNNIDIGAIINATDHEYTQDIYIDDICKADEDVVVFSWIVEPQDFISPLDVYAHLGPSFNSVRPRAHFEETARVFRRRHLDERYIAIHVRGGDKLAEQGNLYDLVPVYFEEIDKARERLGTDCLFLATDNPALLSQFRERYPDIVYQEEATRDEWAAHGNGLYYDRRYQLGSEALTDLILARNAQFFIGNFASYFSRAVFLWREDPAGTTSLVDQMGLAMAAES